MDVRICQQDKALQAVFAQPRVNADEVGEGREPPVQQQLQLKHGPRHVARRHEFLQRRSEKYEHQEKPGIKANDSVSQLVRVWNVRNAHHPQPVAKQIFMIVG